MQEQDPRNVIIEMAANKPRTLVEFCLWEGVGGAGATNTWGIRLFQLTFADSRRPTSAWQVKATIGETGKVAEFCHTLGALRVDPGWG